MKRLLKLVCAIGMLLPSLTAVMADAPRPDAEFSWALRQNKLELTVAHNCYVYAASVELNAVDGTGKAMTATAVPATVLHADAFSGEKTAVFASGTHVWTFAAAPATVAVAYQGCRDAEGDQAAQCFLPRELTLGAAAAAPVKSSDGAVADRFAGFDLRKLEGYAPPADYLKFLSGGDAVSEGTSALAGRGFFVVVLLVLLGGLGLNLTPCVLPLIPVNLAILGATDSGARGGFLRGAVYGLGMALAYGTLGVLVLLTGTRLGTLNSSAFFNFGIALVFAMLALAMFEVFQIDLSRFQSRVNPTRFGKGKILTAFVMGAVAALLAGACVAPVVIGVLLFSGSLYAAGNIWALLLPFLLGVGMALPWPFAGAGLAIIPKPGRYMVRIKQVFGVIILLAALYYGYTGLTLLELDSRSDAPAAELAKLDEGLRAARADGKPLLIDFWASWCKNCLAMEKNTFQDAAVRRTLESRFIVVKIQVEKPGEAPFRALLDQLGVSGFPASVIASPNVRK